jgi:hypothetical protein
MRRFVLFFLLLAGCHRACALPSGVDAGDASSVVEASTGEFTLEDRLPKELADSPPFGNDNRRAVCGTTVKGTCEIIQTKSAGTDALGRNLLVVTVRTSEPDKDAGPTTMPDENLIQREHWVLGTKNGVLVFRARIASEMAHVDDAIESTLTVGSNELETTQGDIWPSSWDPHATRTFQLSPPRLTMFSNSTYNSFGAEGIDDERVDFRTGASEGSATCGPRREAKFFSIPGIHHDAALDPARGMGTCAGDVDGTKDHGFMKKGNPDKASGFFRAAYLGTSSSDALYVEVHDDRFTNGDRLEFRVGSALGAMRCDMPGKVQTFTIDGAGRISPLGLVVARRIRDEANVRTFEITIPKNDAGIDEYEGVAIDMIDDDDGATRTISTIPAKQPTLGLVASVQEVECADTPDGPMVIPTPSERAR